MKNKPVKKVALLSGCILLTILLIIQYFSGEEAILAIGKKETSKEEPNVMGENQLKIEPVADQKAEDIEIALDSIQRLLYITLPNPKGEFDMNQIRYDSSYIEKVTWKASGKKAKITVALKDDCSYTKDIIENAIYIRLEKLDMIRKQTVVLDPGHGGTDVGAGREGIYEKDINLAVAKRVKGILEKAGYVVILTREGDFLPSVEERADFVNRMKPTLFVSIHCNDSEENTANGTEILYPVNGGKEQESQQLAQLLCKSVVQAVGTRDRGIKNGNDIHIVRHSKVPMVLVEMGFMSHEGDFRILSSGKGQKKFAKGIADGIVKALAEKEGKANG